MYWDSRLDRDLTTHQGSASGETASNCSYVAKTKSSLKIRWNIDAGLFVVLHAKP